MNHLHNEIKKLKSSFIEMLDLIKTQVNNSNQSLIKFDKDLAREVVFNEKRVNAFELKIDKDCESIFALFNPVANDLRFVLSTLKSNSNLERMGDNAEGIASFVLDLDSAFHQNIIKELELDRMSSICMDMLENVKLAYANDDTESARILFEKDEELNTLNNRANKLISKYILENPENIDNLLRLLILVRKIERTGDLIKSIAEEIIFYVEANVIRHGKNTIKGVN